MISHFVTVDPDEPVRGYWQRRLEQHMHDSYRGRPLIKMPEDLRVYQHVIEDSQPKIIIELGTWMGGSAVWFADQLTALCGGGHVITIEKRPDLAPYGAIDDPRITQYHDTFQKALPKVGKQVEELKQQYGPNAGVMVIEDSEHHYENTLQALQQYTPFVTPGCYFVVEDTITSDPLSIWPEQNGGCAEALDHWLETSTDRGRFERKHLAIYGITMHMGGWLLAVK